MNILTLFMLLNEIFQDRNIGLVGYYDGESYLQFHLTDEEGIRLFDKDEMILFFDYMSNLNLSTLYKVNIKDEVFLKRYFYKIFS